MRTYLPLALIAALIVALCVIACNVHGAGIESSDNFIALTPTRDYSQLIVNRAEDFRAGFTREWFGDSAPASTRTIISVELSDTESSGFTWAKDDPSRRFHNVYLKASAEAAAGPLLQHEVAHTVMATIYPNRLPEWFEEGVATRYDDEGRKQQRQEIVRSWVAANQWPDLRSVLSGSIDSSDVDSYAVSNTLVEFLLTHYTKPQLTRVADQIEYSEPLEREWRAWVQENYL